MINAKILVAPMSTGLSQTLIRLINVLYGHRNQLTAPQSQTL